MKAKWDDVSAIIGSADDFYAIIARIRSSQQPTMLWLLADDGSLLTVGVGRDESVLAYVDPDGMTFHSVGDLGRPGHLQFLNGDKIDDFMLEMAIPERVALAAAREFVANRNRPAAIHWEADWPEDDDRSAG